MPMNEQIEAVKLKECSRSNSLLPIKRLNISDGDIEE